MLHSYLSVTAMVIPQKKLVSVFFQAYAGLISTTGKQHQYSGEMSPYACWEYVFL
jgi:hypothetical protein